jgi:hypothetical protein
VLTHNGVVVTATQTRGPGAANFLGGQPGGSAMNAHNTANPGSAWYGWTITIAMQDGQGFNAIDLSSGPNGIFGPGLRFHQRWTDPEEEGNYTQKSPQVASLGGVDSGMWVGAGALPIGASFDEDNSLLGSPLSSNDFEGYGVGTFIEGSWAWDPETPGSDGRIVAYLVVQDINGVRVTGTAQRPGQAFDFNVIIPEPATASLLLIGAMGLLARRRRMAA